MKLLAGNSNRTLSQDIADHLDMPLTRAQVKRFADNEVFAIIRKDVAEKAQAAGAAPKRVIVVPGRLVNVVV